MTVDSAFLVDLGDAAVRSAAPLALATIGGVVCERSGVFNIGMEGMMLTGAFCAVVTAFTADAAGLPTAATLLLAASAGVLAGIALGLLHALLCIKNRADQIVSGIAINLLALGATSMLYRLLAPRMGSGRVPGFGPLEVPLLGRIPYLGPIFFRQSLLVYLVYLLPFGVALVLYRMPWGLKLRSVGEYAEGAHAAGIGVERTRYLAVSFSGAMAGLGGAALALGGVRVFTPNMTAGRGYIVLAAIVVAKWDPRAGVLACVLFGVADAFQLRAQALGVGIPSEFLLMIPYLLTILVMAGAIGRTSAPSQLGQHFDREP
ncbi:MAG: ral nucleoside transport system permease protein [Microbacteriaceae bacterium]|nr:ral nucleoside transport system permease protein [Microbacteriaceae bacterium]